MDVNVLRWTFAFFSIILLVILLLMAMFHQSTSKASGIALIITVFSSTLLFGAAGAEHTQVMGRWYILFVACGPAWLVI